VFNFALIGAAGFVAPRHMEAIKLVGGRLVAALDPHDSVGILDRYFPECRFFTEFERFDRFCSREVKNGRRINYVTVCSPNYLHDAHCRFGLRIGADVICEKPLVLRERNLDALARLEEETGKRIWNILQLRLSPAAVRLKENLNGEHHVCRVTYHTPRGRWYQHSWKGDPKKSGGLHTNIGVHLFDLLQWLLGAEVHIEHHFESPYAATGLLRFPSADAHYALSIQADHPPLRRVVVDGDAVDMTQGFAHLHVKSYENILAGKGFGIEAARNAVRICEKLRMNHP